MKRGPYCTAKALQKARQANETSLERILQKESALAWRAYYAVNKQTQHQRGFSGKAELIRLLDDLRSNSIEQQCAFAKQLALAMETEEVNGSRQGAKRPRTTTIQSPIEASVRPTTTTTTSSTDMGSIDAEHYVSEQPPCQLVAQNNVYVGAPLNLAQELFHEQFWDAIARIPSTKPPLADISMIFQQGDIREHFGILV
ncbi:hypothetical protein CEP51_014996 [Fusarium floridanum]|uniref:Uncharacterized protein n=1 Tax=Fusarium floridanum TaxID=1325733 RepID=A0A428PID8_9HYPO|nr:hypothetical protein CEP51_014996 [Fusarium floridanum]